MSIDAISDMIDFRKINGASDTVLRNLLSTELCLDRARKTVYKMTRLLWTQDLDIETLDGRGHWASGNVSFASLRKHREDVQSKSGSSQPLGPSDPADTAAFQGFRVFLLLPHAYKDFARDFASKKWKNNNNCEFVFRLNCGQCLTFHQGPISDNRFMSVDAA